MRFALAVAALVAAIFPAAAHAQDLVQTACLSTKEMRGCVQADGLQPLAFRPALAVSPDGRHLYRASATCEPTPEGSDCFYTGSIRLYQRSAMTGELTAVPDATVSIEAWTVALSRDGRFMFVGSSQRITVFERDPDSGRLTRVAGVDGRGFGPAQALGYARIALTRDGRRLYAASERGHSLMAFRWDPSRRALTLLQCFDWLGECGRRDRRLEFVHSVAVSPEGDDVYASGLSARFRLDRRSGRLRAVRGRDERVEAVVFSRTGRQLYLTRREGVRGFARRLRDGRLRSLGAVTGDQFAHAKGLALSGDGRHAFVAAPVAQTVSLLVRNRRTGRLAANPPATGCVTGGLDSRCEPGNGLDGVFAVAAVGPRDVYAAGPGTLLSFARR